MGALVCVESKQHRENECVASQHDWPEGDLPERQHVEHGNFSSKQLRSLPHGAVSTVGANDCGGFVDTTTELITTIVYAPPEAPLLTGTVFPGPYVATSFSASAALSALGSVIVTRTTTLPAATESVRDEADSRSAAANEFLS